jgi:Protein of unknown function (DUF1360)
MTMVDRARRVSREYSGDEERPLGSFLALMGGYAAAVGTMSAVVRSRDVELPDGLSWKDMALLALATHKASRVIAKAPVTSPLRAPFVTFQGASGEAELAEEVHAHGPKHAIGEFVTCPFCLSQWIATGLAFGLVLAPRQTRLATATLAALVGSDALQFLYSDLQQLSIGHNHDD